MVKKKKQGGETATKAVDVVKKNMRMSEGADCRGDALRAASTRTGAPDFGLCSRWNPRKAVAVLGCVAFLYGPLRDPFVFRPKAAASVELSAHLNRVQARV